MIVLIADDFEEHRLLMRRVVEKSGHRVVEAKDGREAIDAARRERPELIFLYLALPILDGLTVARRIRDAAEGHGPAIVAVSAYDTNGLREAALEAGCDEYVAKPTEAAELEGVLDRFLASADPFGGAVSCPGPAREES